MSFAYYCKYAMSTQFQTMVSATGEDGRVHSRTTDNPRNQVSSAFEQQALQMANEPSESNQFSVGSDQSKTAIDLETLKQHSKTPVRVDSRADFTGGGFYHPKEDFIGISEGVDPNILAHEIGHTKFQNSLLGKITQSAPARLMHNLSPLGMLALGGKLQGDFKKRLLKSMGLSFGMSAPTLISEGGADYHGYQTLKELGADDARLKEFRNKMILPAASYLAAPIANTAFGMHLSRPTKPANTKTAGRALARTLKFRDLDVSIETDKGSYRRWYDPHTKQEGKTLMQYPYGYIRRTQGMDGDHIDCFVGPNEKSDKIFVILTNKAPNFDRIDEEKCMLGFDSAEQAKKVFLDHYSDRKFFNSMKIMSYNDFKDKALATLNGGVKKLSAAQDASSLAGFDSQNSDFLETPRGRAFIAWNGFQPGTFMSPSTRVDRMFRAHDNAPSTDAVEGNTNAHPAEPSL